MIDYLVTLGQALSLLVMLLGGYLAIRAALDTAKRPDEDAQ